MHSTTIPTPFTPYAVRTPDGMPGMVVARSTISGRVVVRRWNGWTWLCDRAYDVAALAALEVVEPSDGVAAEAA